MINAYNIVEATRVQLASRRCKSFVISGWTIDGWHGNLIQAHVDCKLSTVVYPVVQRHSDIENLLRLIKYVSVSF